MTKPTNAAEATALIRKIYRNENLIERAEIAGLLHDYVNDPAFVRVPVELAKSFAHLGVDFGHGPYMPSLEEIEELQALVTASKGEGNG